MPCSTRALQTTLLSCGTTLALSVTSIWGDPMLTDFKVKSPSAYYLFLSVASAFPWVITQWRLYYMLLVWRVKLSRSHMFATENHDASIFEWLKYRFRSRSKVGIIAVCPLIIPVPDLEGEAGATADEVMIACMVDRGDCVLLDDSRVENLCPLVLTPGKSYSSDVMEDMRRYYNVYAAEMANPAAAGVQHDENRTSSPAGAGNREVKGKYLYFGVDVNLRLRKVLLDEGLVPPYEQLCFVRTRSRFETIVTVLQALGFLLGLVERNRQGLVFSPLEALISIYALIAVVQMTLDLFACGSFRTPLLLSLTPAQFRSFINGARGSSPIRYTGYLAFVAVALVGTIAGALENVYIRYFGDFSPPATASSKLNSNVFMVYCVFSVVVSIINGFFLWFRQSYDGLRRPIRYVCFSVVASLVLVVLVVLAVALLRSVVDWELYDAAARVIVTPAWLLPHVYSN